MIIIKRVITTTIVNNSNNNNNNNNNNINIIAGFLETITMASKQIKQPIVAPSCIDRKASFELHCLARSAQKAIRIMSIPCGFNIWF